MISSRPIVNTNRIALIPVERFLFMDDVDGVFECLLGFLNDGDVLMRLHEGVVEVTNAGGEGE